jgi:hypothetical protein
MQFHRTPRQNHQYQNDPNNHDADPKHSDFTVNSDQNHADKNVNRPSVDKAALTTTKVPPTEVHFLRASEDDRFPLNRVRFVNKQLLRDVSAVPGPA